MDAKYLSKQRKAELKYAFSICDKKGTGYLSAKEVIHLLKSIGVKVSCSDRKALELENMERGDFTFEDFLTIGEVVYNDVAIGVAIFTALKEISNSSVAIQRAQLREILLKIGSTVKLAPIEVDLFLGIECDTSNKKDLDFDTFINRILRE